MFLCSDKKNCRKLKQRDFWLSPAGVARANWLAFLFWHMCLHLFTRTLKECIFEAAILVWPGWEINPRLPVSRWRPTTLPSSHFIFSEWQRQKKKMGGEKEKIENWIGLKFWIQITFITCIFNSFSPTHTHTHRCASYALILVCRDCWISEASFQERFSVWLRLSTFTSSAGRIVSFTSHLRTVNVYVCLFVSTWPHIIISPLFQYICLLPLSLFCFLLAVCCLQIGLKIYTVCLCVSACVDVCVW